MHRSGMAALCLLLGALAPPATAQARDEGLSREAARAAQARILTEMEEFRLMDRANGLFVPDNLGAAHGAVPLLIVLHGAGGVYAGIAARTGFNALAEKHGFLVVYPDSAGTPAAGERTMRWDPYGRRVDDFAYLGALIGEIGQRHRIDPARIFVAGMSNGAAMAQAAACRIPEIDGVAAVAAAISPRAHGPLCGQTDRPVRFVGFFGTVDRGGQLEKFEESVGMFAALNGCTGGFATEALPDLAPEDGSTVELRTALTPAGAPCPTPVHYYRIEGGGHFWPGAPYSEARVGGQPASLSMDIDASEIIVTFFGLDRSSAASGQ